MRKALRSQNGSSTILIALMLITLVVFGVLSMTSSSSELKLARRNAATHKNYYTLDSEGTRYLYEVKARMLEAYKKALDIVNEASEMKDAITKENLSSLDEESLKLESFAAIYFSAFRELSPEDVPEAAMDPLKLEESGICLRKTFALSDNGHNVYLEIELNIMAPAARRSIEDCLKVNKWRLWQEPFEYNQKIELWEGKP